MKTILLLLAIVFSLSVNAQKQDSLVLEIRMDTAVWKNVIQLINENINGNTTTGKMVLQNILVPLYNCKLVPREKIIADKPKEIKKP